MCWYLLVSFLMILFSGGCYGSFFLSMWSHVHNECNWLLFLSTAFQHDLLTLYVTIALLHQFFFKIRTCRCKNRQFGTVLTKTIIAR